MAESAVKVIKKLFKKPSRQGEDPYLALLAHRSTPSTNDDRSPTEKLMGQNIQTLVPDLWRMVSKQGRGNHQLPAKFQPRHLPRVKQHHDCTSKQLPDIPVGSTVHIQEKGTWPLKAKVLKKADTPRSFVLETEKGTIRRRNHQDLLMTNEQFISLPNDDNPLSQSTYSSTAPNDTTEVIQNNVPVDIPPNSAPTHQPCSPTVSYQTSLCTSINPPKHLGFDV